MRLSAELLDTWDRCERRFAFSQKWRAKSISPLGLLYSALEAALVSSDPEQAARDETVRMAKTHDLASGDQNAFMIVRHTGYLAEIIARALQMRFGVMKRVDPTPEWESALFEGVDGSRHRIELVSHWDDDRLRASAHSWRVIGELVALQSPLTLTAIVIGPSRGGKRHSAWSKGFMHPNNHNLRFARRIKGNEFAGSWEQIWREHYAQVTTEQWLEGMNADGVLDDLILSREIRFDPSDHRMIAARAEMGEIAERMTSASESAPMRRSSCDETGRGACPFQQVCYSQVETDPSKLLHLYRAANK